MFWRNKRKNDFSRVSSDSRRSQKIALNERKDIFLFFFCEFLKEFKFLETRNNIFESSSLKRFLGKVSGFSIVRTWPGIVISFCPLCNSLHFPRASCTA